ncbi:MAG TPA: cytidine deaminase [Kiritimatiellia bacterium]|mgnify:FL=1|nr:cytidine deaminase [Kiritimatiellia bacterium]HPC58128.1 cytidine deaminase [Kiritimatiellia bacterium]HPR68666.1 cytidine deaminase [Kiritimatiellia bacterium]
MQNVKLSDLTAADRRLVEQAIAVREKAYAPFSKYKCGAAVRDIRNRIHVGCNVETLDMTLTTHAEMDAINGMIKSGVFQLKALAVAVLSVNGYAFPCGLCRQKIREFAIGDEARIIAVGVNAKGRITKLALTTIGELYPHSFTSDCLP